ncbi:MAG: AgmX/PglI C-terminal domain-containing protein [Myxococcota bacterium]
MAQSIRITVTQEGRPILDEVFERDVVKIGRLASAHVKLEEPSVSRIHAVIDTSGSDMQLIDMGSLEGTKLNGQSVSKAGVAPGDVIEVGPYTLRVEEPRVKSVPPTPPEPSADVEEVTEESIRGAKPTSGELRAMPVTKPSSDALPLDSQERPSVVTVGPARIPAGPTITKHPPVSEAAATQPPASRRKPEIPAAATVPAAAFRATVSPSPSLSKAPVEPAPTPVVPAATPAVPPPNAAAHAQTVPVQPRTPVESNLASDDVAETDRALEIKALWGGNTVLDSVSAFDQPRLSAGDARQVKGWGPFQKIERCDLEIPSKGLGLESFPIAKANGRAGGSYDLQWPAQLGGRIHRANGQVIEFSELKEWGAIVDGDDSSLASYPLKPAETVVVDHGAISIQMRYVKRSSTPPLPLAERIDYNWLNTFLLVLFAHVLAVTGALLSPQTNARRLDDIDRAVTRFAQMKLTPEQRRKQKSLLADLKKGEKAEKSKGNEGKMGGKKAPKREARQAVKGKPNEKDQARAALDKLLGANIKGQVASVMGAPGLGGELESAIGNIAGRRVGDARGLGGLGTRGSGPGGGGLSSTSIGLGALGTRGRGGGGTGDEFAGAGSIGKKKDRDINISAGRTIVMGSLPKEVIRRVIQENIAQIRYCYEKELTRSPGLFGKVATEFVIGGNGRVQTTKVTQSTLGSPPVERCMMQKIKTWRFPKPKGGGIVVVKYPFALNSSG